MKAHERYNSLIQWFFQEAGRMYGFEHDPTVDWRWVWAQMKTESNFDQNAMSPVGARGLLQLMADTWGPGFIEHAFNPEENIKRGVDYLGRLWGMFRAEDGIERWRFCTASYNCGAGWVIKAQTILKARGKPTNQWNLIAEILPQLTGPSNAAETTKYVQKIEEDYFKLQSGSG